MSSQINALETILNSERTVFTIQSLRLLTDCDDSSRLTKSLNYYSKSGKIRNPRKGIYTKPRYDEKEMACSLFRPAYISLEYVLQRSGVIFQYDNAITCVCYLNREVEVDGNFFKFRIIKPEIWVGMEGIEQYDNVYIATPERAFLDMIYLSAGNCCFDNIKPLDKKKINALLPLYKSKTLTSRVSDIFKA